MQRKFLLSLVALVSAIFLLGGLLAGPGAPTLPGVDADVEFIRSIVGAQASKLLCKDNGILCTGVRPDFVVCTSMIDPFTGATTCTALSSGAPCTIGPNDADCPTCKGTINNFSCVGDPGDCTQLTPVACCTTDCRCKTVAAGKGACLCISKFGPWPIGERLVCQ